MSQTADEVPNRADHGMKQLGARLPQWMMDGLHKASKEQSVPIRQIVENFIAAGLIMLNQADKNTGSQPGTKAYTGPVPSHVTVVGPCVGYGTGGFVWCVRCDENKSPEPAEHCYLVIEACTRSGCGMENEWPLCPVCLTALADKVAYLCVNCLQELEQDRRLLERGKASLDEIGERIDAFLKPSQDRCTDPEGIETGRPQPDPPRDIPVLTVHHLHGLTSRPLFRLLDALAAGPLSLPAAKRIARKGRLNATDLLCSVHGVLIDLDVDTARVAPLVQWPDLPPDLRVHRLLAEGVTTSHIRAILAAHIAGPITGIRHLSRITGMSYHTARDAHACLADLGLLAANAPERDPRLGDGDP